MIYNNILKTIGNTPLVQINNFDIGDSKIFAKLEGVNPGGSIKDRIALQMIEEAEKTGELNKDKTIIEASSGNTGIALAMIGAVKGYKVDIVISEGVSIERRKMIASFGANIILTDNEKGTDGAIFKVKEMIAENPKQFFCTDQFSNKHNKNAHYATTAKEIIEQTDGKFDYFVAAIGTSGTLMGVAKYLKEKNPKIKIVSAEPIEGHYIQGLKNMTEAIVPAIYDKSKLDEIIKIKTSDAFKTVRGIVRKEGIFVGMSSGAAMLASLNIAKKHKNVKIITIFPDRGEKYLSTDLFE